VFDVKVLHAGEHVLAAETVQGPAGPVAGQLAMAVELLKRLHVSVVPAVGPHAEFEMLQYAPELLPEAGRPAYVCAFEAVVGHCAVLKLLQGG